MYMSVYVKSDGSVIISGLSDAIPDHSCLGETVLIQGLLYAETSFIISISSSVLADQEL